MNASIAKAKAWIADENWLPTPDLKEVLRRLVEAVEAPSGGPVLPPTREPLNPGKRAAHQNEALNVTPEKPSAKRARP